MRTTQLKRAIFLGMALLLPVKAVQGQVIDFGRGQWVDLTHDFAEDAIYWPTAKGFHLETVHDGVTPGGYYYAAYNFSTAEHGGTHLDAPVHFAAGRHSAEQVPLERLNGSAVVVDISTAAAAQADYQANVEDLLAWEAANGAIPPRAIVLFRSGWSSRWPDAQSYLGTAERGAEAVPQLHFPGISEGAARWLVAREVSAVGIDTASVDHGQSTDFMAHRVLYEANIPGFENVTRLDLLPARGAWVVALPMKIRGGSGAPLRIAAFLPEPD